MAARSWMTRRLFFPRIRIVTGMSMSPWYTISLPLSSLYGPSFVMVGMGQEATA